MRRRDGLTPFERLLAPRPPGLDVAASIFAERPDLVATFGDPRSPGMLEWLAVHGVREYPDRLAALYAPVPPPELRGTACCGDTDEMHLATSVADFKRLGQLWEIFSDKPFLEVASALDFGCGCGRLARWFTHARPEFDLVGADVAPSSVAWCREHLAGRFVVNGPRPPLPLADDAFELVYALSVFSHLDREANLAWLRELARVCRPDGLMLLSTHGAFALAVLTQSAEHQEVMGLSAEQGREDLRRLARESFVQHVYAPDVRASAEGLEPTYGQAFFTEAFVREAWADDVELVGHVPAALNLFQDFFVVRPRRSGA